VHLDHLPGRFFGPSNLVELLRHRARCQPKDIAFTYLVDGEDEQVHITYEELDRQARAIGAWLESYDLVGERALLLYPAGLEFIAAFFGCLYAGVTAVTAYPPRRNRSLERIQAIADDAQAKAALTTDIVLSRVEPLIDETPHLKELTWLATCRVPDGMETRWEIPDIHGGTLAFLQYTSGSTGTPKGVMLNHANLVHNSALIAFTFEHTRSGTGVFWLPSYHDMGLIGGILQPIYIGRPNVLMSAMSFLQKPYRWLSAITRFKGTTSGGPNFAYDLCVRKITPEQRETLDLSCWEVAFNGAEPVRAEVLDAFVEAFEPCGFRREAFYPCFGLAEATLLVSGGFAYDEPLTRKFDATALGKGRVVEAKRGAEGSCTLVGCGQNLPDQTVVIADPDTRRKCSADKIGEIWVSSPSVAKGYWRQPELTEVTFRARLKDSGEGHFLRTGDLGFMFDGELFITSRIKDLIIVHGVNHYPQDIEQTAQRSHDRLRPDGCAAFSVEQDGRQQLVIVQEVHRHKTADHEAICESIRRAVAAEHDLMLNAVVLIRAGSIPKTSSGKIQRHACRSSYVDGSLAVVGEWYAAGAKAAAAGSAEESDEGVIQTTLRPGRPVATSKNGHKTRLQSKTVEVVLEEIRRVAKERAVGLKLDTPIIETGLDSLERMEILASLEERFGGRLPEEILPDLHTARQVIEAVQKYLGAEPRGKSARSADEEIPAAHYQLEQFPEIVQLKQTLGLAETSGLGNPFFTVHDGVMNDRTTVDGRELINYASFNYLGMSGDPAVTQAAREALERYGTSVSASRLVSGENQLHLDLEHEIAEFLGVEDSAVFPAGHGTNETVLGHLLGPGDMILHDALIHNSVIQGAILSGARRRPFAHNNWSAANELLANYRHEYRRVLVVVEGVYSMDGDFPDLPKFIAMKNRHRAMLMIDEAHSLGTMGKTGRGICEHFGAEARDVEILMGTISKGLGSGGGYIAGSKNLVKYLKYTAPGFVFATGISPANTAAALAALRLLDADPQRVARLRQASELFLGLCKRRGLNTGESNGTPIIPVILGNSMHCLVLYNAMFRRGVNVKPILHPAVEESAARLRYFINSSHTAEQIRRTVDIMTEELEKISPDYLSGASRSQPVSP